VIVDDFGFSNLTHGTSTQRAVDRKRRLKGYTGTGPGSKDDFGFNLPLVKRSK
jgi:hypothetical protein